MEKLEQVKAITAALDSREIVFPSDKDGKPLSPVEVCTIAGEDRDELKKKLVELLKTV